MTAEPLRKLPPVLPDGSTTFFWADKPYRFRLPIAQLQDLQTECDAGPLQILNRLRDGTWRVEDVKQTLRLGLIGGGLPPSAAWRLAERYVVDGAWIENAGAAQLVLMAALVAPKGEPLGKRKRRTTTPKTPDASNSQPSSD